MVKIHFIITDTLISLLKLGVKVKVVYNSMAEESTEKWTLTLVRASLSACLAVLVRPVNVL